jgi:hypothetical protein
MSNNPQIPITVRFWRHVTKGDPSACWLWRGACNNAGYGTIGAGGTTAQGTARMTTAHRVSWEMHNSPIPKGQHVLHRCDVRACVNPAHLFLGSNRDNMRDAVRKGRHAGVLPGSPAFSPRGPGGLFMPRVAAQATRATLPARCDGRATSNQGA